MLTKQEKHELLAAAIAGDEQALERVVHELDGWIWRQYTQQRVRPKAEDWYHECRLVMYRCLAKLPQQHWGVLTSYFQRVVYHHVTTIWWKEFQVKFDTVLSDECLAYLPESAQQRLPASTKVEWCDMKGRVQADLKPAQQQLLQMRLQGYPLKECAAQLQCSVSWCCQQWRLIQKYFDCLKQHRFYR